mgnify:CR=1 FL=1
MNGFFKTKTMKKNLIIGAVILVLIIAIGMNIKNSYNSMVSKNEAVEGGWAQVESVYQLSLIHI